MAAAPKVPGSDIKTHLHTPKAVTYHEQSYSCRFMIGHSLGRMESRFRAILILCNCVGLAASLAWISGWYLGGAVLPASTRAMTPSTVFAACGIRIKCQGILGQYVCPHDCMSQHPINADMQQHGMVARMHGIKGKLQSAPTPPVGSQYSC